MKTVVAVNLTQNPRGSVLDIKRLMSSTLAALCVRVNHPDHIRNGGFTKASLAGRRCLLLEMRLMRAVIVNQNSKIA